MAPSSILTLADAAEYLGLNPSTLRWQIKNGRLPATKIGPVWTVTRADLDRYRSQHLGKVGQKLDRSGRPSKPKAPRARRRDRAAVVQPQP